MKIDGRRELQLAAGILDDMPRRIKTARKRIGLSQEGFAKMVGVSRQTACGWESGNPISSENLRSILDVLGDLTRDSGHSDGPMSSATTTVHASAPDRELATMSSLAALSDAERMRVLAWADGRWPREVT